VRRSENVKTVMPPNWWAYIAYMYVNY